MSYTIVLRRAAATVYTFATHTPWLEPAYAYEFDDQDPPRLTGVRKTWSLEGVLYGATETVTSAAFVELQDLLENNAAYPDTARLMRDAVVVMQIGAEAGGVAHDDFRIESLQLLRSDLEWRGEARFRCTISGKRRFVDANNIVRLTVKESFSYDDRGLLTHSLTGEVETLAGTSAEARARALPALLGHTETGSTRFATDGPEGVNVEVQNRGDTLATFVSVLQESGVTLPASVSPAFSLAISTTRTGGDELTTTTVTAAGTGAEAAVRARRPAGDLFSEVITVDDAQRTATAVYTQRAKDAPGRRLLLLHSFTSRGGGKPIRHSQRTGDRAPAPHVLSRTAVELTERITVDVIGVPAIGDFTLPSALDLAEDTDAAQTTWPARIEIGAERSGDRWAAGLTRVYRPIELAEIPEAIGRAVFEPDENSDPAQEARKVGRAARGAPAPVAVQRAGGATNVAAAEPILIGGPGGQAFTAFGFAGGGADGGRVRGVTRLGDPLGGGIAGARPGGFGRLLAPVPGVGVTGDPFAGVRGGFGGTSTRGVTRLGDPLGGGIAGVRPGGFSRFRIRFVPAPRERRDINRGRLDSLTRLGRPRPRRK